MKKIFLFLFILLGIMVQASTVVPYIFINSRLNIDYKSVYAILKEKLSGYDVIERDKYYETFESTSKNTDNSYIIRLMKDNRSADYGVIVRINDCYTERKTEKNVRFVKNPSGSYISYAGTFYQVSQKKLFSYNKNEDKFYQDSNGNYIYLADYPWARTEREKFIKIDGFYTRYSEDTVWYKYSIKGSYSVIDYQSSVVIDSGSIDNSMVSKSSSEMQSFVNSSIRAIKLRQSTFYEEKPKIALYALKNQEYSGYTDQIYGQVQQGFIDDGRYGILDRANIDKIMDELKLDFLGIVSGQAASNMKIASYMVSFVINSLRYEEYTVTEKKSYLNPVNGSYTAGEEVEVGKYYYRKRDGSFTPSATGTYVKKIRKPWERTDSYIPASDFYDVFTQDTVYAKGYMNCTFHVIDLKTGLYMGYMTKELSVNKPLTDLKDRFQSTESIFRSDVNDLLIRQASSWINQETRKLFPLNTLIAASDGDRQIIQAGKNYGVKNSMLFRVVDDYITRGYIKVEQTGEKTSNTRTIRLIKQYDEIKYNNLVYEDFDYYNPFGMQIYLGGGTGGFVTGLGYMFTDIYKNLLGDIRAGMMIHGENSYFLGQAGIKVYTIQETDLSLALAFKTDFKHDISIYPVLEVSTRIFYDLLRYSAGFYFGKESLGFLSLNVCF